eukprot:g4967.t1
MKKAERLREEQRRKAAEEQAALEAEMARLRALKEKHDKAENDFAKAAVVRHQVLKAQNQLKLQLKNAQKRKAAAGKDSGGTGDPGGDGDPYRGYDTGDWLSNLGSKIGQALVPFEAETDPYFVAVQILVHHARGLPATDSAWEHGAGVLGRCDPYVCISLVKGNPIGRQPRYEVQTPVSRTEHIAGSQEPVWDALLDLDVGNHIVQPWDGADMNVYVELWDSDYVVDEKFAHCAVPFLDILEMRGIRYLHLRPLVSARRAEKRKARKKAKPSASDRRGKRSAESDDEAQKNGGPAEGAEDEKTRKRRKGSPAPNSEPESPDKSPGWSERTMTTSDTSFVSTTTEDGGEGHDSSPDENDATSGGPAPVSLRSGRKKKFFTNFRILRLRARFGKIVADKRGRIEIQCFVGHVLGVSSFQLKAFVELRCVRGDPRKKPYDKDGALAASRTPAKFCEHRSCEWNQNLVVSCVPANDVFVSLVLYRSNQVAAENALGHWSVNLFKLLRLSGQRPIKLSPVYVPGRPKPKFPLVANSGIWLSFLGSGVMEEELPDYDNAIELDENLVRTEVVPNILDVAALRAGGERLLPVRIRVNRAVNLPDPWGAGSKSDPKNSNGATAASRSGRRSSTSSSMIPAAADSALFVEVSLLQDSGVGKFLALEPATTELNDAKEFPMFYAWGDEELLLETVPLHDDTLLLGARVMYFRVDPITQQNHFEEVVKGELPFRSLFESAGLRPWKGFVQAPVPRAVRLQWERHEEKSGGQPLLTLAASQKDSEKEPMRLTQGVDVGAVELDMKLQHLDKQLLIWRVKEVRKLGKREVFLRARVKVEMRLLRYDHEAGGMYDPEEDEFIFFPGARQEEHAEQKEAFEKIEKPSKYERRALKKLDAKLGKDRHAELQVDAQETEAAAAKPGGRFVFEDAEFMFNLQSLASRYYNLDEDDEAGKKGWELPDVVAELFSCFHVIVWGQPEPTSFVERFARQWQPLCHFTISVGDLLRCQGLIPLRMAKKQMDRFTGEGVESDSSEGEDEDEQPPNDGEEGETTGSLLLSPDDRTMLKIQNRVKRRIGRHKARPGLFVKVLPAKSMGEITKNPDLVDDLDEADLPEVPKKILLTANVTHARSLPQTRTKFFGGKGCYPWVRANLVRGDPIQEEEDSVAVLEQKKTYTRDGTSVNFKQKLPLGPVSSEDKNMFLHFEVFDTAVLFPYEMIGRCSVSLHDCFQLRGVRPRKLKLIPSGVRGGSDKLDPLLAFGGGDDASSGTGDAAATEDGQDATAQTEGECFLKFEKVDYETEKNLGVQVRVMKIVLPKQFPPFPLENLTEPIKLYAEARLCRNGDPRLCSTDDELKLCTLKKTLRPARFILPAKTRESRARTSGAARITSRKPEFDEVLKVVADDKTHDEDIYFYLSFFYEGKPTGFLKSFFGGREQFQIGHLSIPIATLLQHFGYRGLRLYHPPNVDVSGGYDLTKSRLHVSVECKKVSTGAAVTAG